MYVYIYVYMCNNTTLLKMVSCTFDYLTVCRVFLPGYPTGSAHPTFISLSSPPPFKPTSHPILPLVGNDINMPCTTEPFIRVRTLGVTLESSHSLLLTN